MIETTLSSLSFLQIYEIRDILCKWSTLCDSSFSYKYRDLVKCSMSLYQNVIKKLSEPVWNAIDERFSWIKDSVHRDEVKASATSSFIGLMIYRSLIGHLRTRPIDESLDIKVVLLYIGSDYILDDETISEDVKDLLKTKVKEVFVNSFAESNPESDPESNDPRVDSLVQVLKEILTDEPLSRDGLLLAWDSELKSEQQKNITDFDTLWEISSDKGYKTILMACHIINKGQALIGARALGSLTQHIDDLIDHKVDIQSGIHTSANICMTTNKYHLDYYIYRLFKEVEELEDELLPIKIFFVQVICSCATRNPHTSSELRDLLSKYLLDDKVCDFETFVRHLVSE